MIWRNWAKAEFSNNEIWHKRNLAKLYKNYSTNSVFEKFLFFLVAEYHSRQIAFMPKSVGANNILYKRYMDLHVLTDLLIV